MTHDASGFDLIVAEDALGRLLSRQLPEAWDRLGLAPPRPQRVYVALSRAAGSTARSGLPDLDDAERSFDALAASGAEALIVVSSTQVFEPSHRHLAMTPHTDLPAGRPTDRVAGAWRRLESLARAAAADADIQLTLLRAAPMVVPGGEDFWSRLLRRPIALTYPGFDPMLQLLPVDDLVRALATLTAEPPVPVAKPRVLHLTPSSNLPLRRALRQAGVLRIPVPRTLQAPARKLLAPLGVAPLDQVDYLRHCFTVDGDDTRRRLGLEGSDRDRPQADEAERFDPYGLDKGYVRRLSKTLFRFLHDVWWRVEVRGVEHLPREGPVVLVGIHRGFQPWDGVMAMQHIAGKTGRHVRFLTHPTLIKFPFLAPYMLKLGAVPPAIESADRVLGAGGVLAVFPEGIRGAFLEYGRDIYRPMRFRPDFVAFALRHGAPIVPFVSVGPAEIFPILKNFRWRWWRRWSEWPCLPLTPTLGTLPLPSKWHTRYLPAVHLEQPPSAADDSERVRALSRDIQRTMAMALAGLARRRRHVFWGALTPAATEASLPSGDTDSAKRGAT